MYIGCETNAGKLIGIRNQDLLIQARDEPGLTEHNMQLLGNTVFFVPEAIG